LKVDSVEADSLINNFMKNIKVKYIFEVTKTISIHEDDCPKHLEQEEYENEQIEFAGND